MRQDELLRRVTGALTELGIPHLVTGSVASIFFGEPRFTNDIDIVIDLSAAGVDDLCAAFPADDFYLSKEAARDAVRRCGQFNLIHPASGLKVDFIVAAGSAFDRSRFARARRVRPAPDFTASFASPEDVILKKMQTYLDGGSDKHLRDIAGILAMSGEALDREYLDEWASRLELDELWRGILERLGEG